MSSTTPLKQRISSPLEAGPSILDTPNLPPHLNQALEYVSKRLTRKALHISLIVVRREYQLPSATLPSSATASSSTSSTGMSLDFGPLSPSRLASPMTASLRQLVRRGVSSPSAAAPSPAASETAFLPLIVEPAAATSPRRLPPTPGSAPLFAPLTPCTPCTPCTPASITTGTSVTSSSEMSGFSGSPNPFGIMLLYATPLTPKAERTLRQTIERAERKFRTGTGFLPATASAAACGLNSDLVRRSLRQNEVLFSSEGLTLLSLDRLYAFKSALAAYARTTLRSKTTGESTSAGIEDAVDELRRLVLSRGGRRLDRRELYRVYEWIGVGASALGDVERMYRRAYGGAECVGAFEELQSMTSPPLTARPILPREAGSAQAKTEDESNLRTIPVAMKIVKIGTPPGGKGPALKLQTSFADEKPATTKTSASTTPESSSSESSSCCSSASSASSVASEGVESVRKADTEVIQFQIKIDGIEDDEDGDITARPIAAGSMPFWNTIDAILQPSQKGRLQESGGDAVSPVIQRLNTRASHLGPVTPNGYDDISPVTRGEWGFLFSGDGWNKSGKTAVVETC